jgi:hypothetical protein
MSEEMRIMLDNHTLAILLRSNLSCYVNKVITPEILDEMTSQIIESIEYFLSRTEGKSIL